MSVNDWRKGNETSTGCVNYSLVRGASATACQLMPVAKAINWRSQGEQEGRNRRGERRKGTVVGKRIKKKGCCLSEEWEVEEAEAESSRDGMCERVCVRVEACECVDREGTTRQDWAALD